MIKTSKHKFFELNLGKKQLLLDFIQEYRKVVDYFIDHLWSQDYHFTIKSKPNHTFIFSIQNDILDLPLFLEITNIKFDTRLSCRAIKSAAAQALGMVKGAVNLRKYKLYLLSTLKNEKKQTRKITRWLKRHPSKKPNASNTLPELDTNCIDIMRNIKDIPEFFTEDEKFIDEFFNLKEDIEEYESKKEELEEKIERNADKRNGSPRLDRFAVLHSLGETFYLETNKPKRGFGIIALPFYLHDHSDKLADISIKKKHLKGIMISESHIFLRWEIDVPNKKEKGEIVRVDTGINNIVILSNKTSTSDYPDIHGHTLKSNINKVQRKIKGSKGFKKALEHLDNHIRCSINKLTKDMSEIKQINLEYVSNFRYRKNVGTFLNYSRESLIREKLIEASEIHGVRVEMQDSAYKSQRCSECGYVDKKNRNKSVFRCLDCDFECDADYNASLNNKQGLPSAKFFLFQRKYKQFFWKEEGFYDVSGLEIIVPITLERDDK